MNVTFPFLLLQDRVHRPLVKPLMFNGRYPSNRASPASFTLATLISRVDLALITQYQEAAQTALGSTNQHD